LRIASMASGPRSALPTMPNSPVCCNVWSAKPFCYGWNTHKSLSWPWVPAES
jgi:hypothetical protein